MVDNPFYFFYCSGRMMRYVVKYFYIIHTFTL